MKRQSIVSDATGSAREVFLTFLRLGCLSFGGPIAHLGYFRSEIVERLEWCTEETFAQLVALAQSLPGPASSQVCFALGLLRARWAGALAAWLGFTAPSAAIMLALALAHAALEGRVGLAVVHGLQLVAVAVVAQAIVTMQARLAADWPRRAIALSAALVVWFGPTSFNSVLAIAFGAVAGGILLRTGGVAPVQPIPISVTRRSAALASAVFFLLLVLPPQLGGILSDRELPVFNAFYRTGALVFGGGHVVLPLLEGAVVKKGWVEQQSFLSGYAAAQAIPGPLFSFAAYLGAVIGGSSRPLLLGLVALVSIFLPGMLLVVAVLPFWTALSKQRPIQRSLRGINASVVGILAAAFITPVCTSAVDSLLDGAIALFAFVLLVRWKAPPWIIVSGVALISFLAASVRMGP